MKIKIVSLWDSDKVLFEAESENTKHALVEAVEAKANLSGAYLRGADLSGADLSDANLSGAYLRGANLSGADLSGAYLRGADLSGTDLSGTYLSGAYLRGANLSGANLSGTNLRDANLRGADLSDANLQCVGSRSDGYYFFLFYDSNTCRIIAGCRYFTLPEAWQHWRETRSDTQLGKETFALLENAEKLAKIRGWIAEDKS